MPDGIFEYEGAKIGGLNFKVGVWPAPIEWSTA